MRYEYQKGESLFEKPSAFDLWMDTEGKEILKWIQENRGKCLICGIRKGLTEHHIIFRHLGGLDLEENKTDLCRFHHEQLHRIEHKRRNINEKFMLTILKQLKEKQ